jgi:hypothetical protein
MAQVNFPNYPRSPADIRISEFSAGGQAEIDGRDQEV